MTTAAPATDAPAPALDAERSLRRVLDLIRDGAPVGAITAARLRGIFGVEFTESSGRYGFAERLTQDWWSSFELDPIAAWRQGQRQRRPPLLEAVDPHDGASGLRLEPEVSRVTRR